MSGALDRWRAIYNHGRPHEALGLAVPAHHYQPSPRPYPARLPEIVSGPDDLVRQVFGAGQIHLAGRQFFVSEVLYGQPVALRPTAVDGRYAAYYCRHYLRTIDFNQPAERVDEAGRCAIDVSEQLSSISLVCTTLCHQFQLIAGTGGAYGGQHRAA